MRRESHSEMAVGTGGLAYEGRGADVAEIETETEVENWSVLAIVIPSDSRRDGERGGRRRGCGGRRVVLVSRRVRAQAIRVERGSWCSCACLLLSSTYEG